MKPGTKYTFPKVKCDVCGKMIGENWIIRHWCKFHAEGGRKNAHQ